jgi:hypothetical protein
MDHGINGPHLPPESLVGALHDRDPAELAAWNRQADRPKVYIDTADWWVGWYRGPGHHYVCLLPCVVIRWKRR